MTRRTRISLAVVAVLGLGASCGETNMDAIARLRPRGHVMRERLADVGARLPPVGTRSPAFGPSRAFDPPLVLDYREPRSTADVLMESQLRDPDRDTSGELDPMLSPDLLSCLMWTGPKNPLDASVWDDRTELGRDCERAFAIRWLVVVRQRRYELPETVELEVFVVDMPRSAVVATFPIALAGRYRKEDIGRGRWASEAGRQLRSDAFVVARCELVKRLDALPGTELRFREEILPGSGHPCTSVPKTFGVTEPSMSELVP